MTTPTIGTHAWYGSLDPGNPNYFSCSCLTFSVGCFEWLPAQNRKGYRRSPVKVRIKGFKNHPQAVYDKAKEVCAQLDAGTYNGPKNITVRTS